jgi:hypothetical protein
MSTPNFAQIYIALRNRLTYTGGPVIVQPGQDYPTAVQTPFVLIQDESLDTPRAFTGATPERQRGIFALAVMTPLEWTHAQSLGMADAVALRFPKGLVLPIANGNPVRIERPGQLVASAYRDGAFNRQPVHIYWACRPA